MAQKSYTLGRRDASPCPAIYFDRLAVVIAGGGPANDGGRGGLADRSQKLAGDGAGLRACAVLAFPGSCGGQPSPDVSGGRGIPPRVRERRLLPAGVA